VPFLTIQNRRSFYRLEGNGGRPVLVLSHSLGADHAMWDRQMADLLGQFQVLRYDTRGHGASEVPKEDATIEELGRDVLDLADALSVAKFYFCGLSLGGMIGQWLGAHAPDRVTALVLANTSPLMAPKSNWDERRRAVLGGGMAAIVEQAMQRFFSAEFLAQNDPMADSIRRTLLGTDPAGYAHCCAAIRDMDQTKILPTIAAPTLVIGGSVDVATPWAGHGELLARLIPGARAIHLPTGHLSNVERPRSFTAAVLDFLAPKAAAATDTLEAGMAVRRAALGDAHVDRAIATANDFNREFQELITRYAWGSIWTRPGLDRRTRRLLVLAITASLGRWEEFRLHLRAGLAHELEPCDVKEALLQTAVYAGVPAANTAFAIAGEEIKASKHWGNLKPAGQSAGNAVD
jgi:3-oxoadipate enol-lactonase/4-carboxymuconolactone decarboxylase